MARRVVKKEETAVPVEAAVLPVGDDTAEVENKVEIEPVAAQPPLAEPATVDTPPVSTPPVDTLVSVRIEAESLVVNHQRRLKGEKFLATYGEYARLAANHPGALLVKLPGSENYK